MRPQEQAPRTAAGLRARRAAASTHALGLGSVSGEGHSRNRTGRNRGPGSSVGQPMASSLVGGRMRNPGRRADGTGRHLENPLRGSHEALGVIPGLPERTQRVYSLARSSDVRSLHVAPTLASDTEVLLRPAACALLMHMTHIGPRPEKLSPTPALRSGTMQTGRTTLHLLSHCVAHRAQQALLVVMGSAESG